MSSHDAAVADRAGRAGGSAGCEGVARVVAGVGEVRRVQPGPGRGVVARGAARAQNLGLAELVEARVRLACYGANAGTKALSVIGSILAGGDSIDDVGVLAVGATPELFDQLRTPSTIGTWLRAFKWSNVREFDAVTRGLLSRLWAAGAGPADPAGALTSDLDSTICQVYGRASRAPTTATPRSAAITRSWPRWPRPAR